jgi:hypothetical protein
MSILVRLDACVAGVDAAYRRQNAGQIEEYCGRLQSLLDRTLTVLEQSEVDTAEGKALPDAITHWAARVLERVDERALVACDPGLEQSLSDLLTVLQEMATSPPPA